MENVKMGGKTIEFNDKFSTTRNVVKDSSFLSGERNGRNEGGLRTRGYGKRSELKKPLISVITVVHDGERDLERAILSVTNQTYDNVEYIIIDGGSTDGTLDIIKKYDDVVDYWLSEPDKGVYDAMNKGIKHFHGDYVLFLGCDDSLFDVFHEAANLFDGSTTSYYGDVILSKNKKSYDGRFFPLKLFIKNIPHQAIFYSKHVFDEYRFDCKYITVADYALNLKIFSNKRYGLEYIPKTMANYNNEYGLSSTLVDHEFSKDKPSIIREYYATTFYWIYMILRFLFKRK